MDMSHVLVAVMVLWVIPEVTAVTRIVGDLAASPVSGEASRYVGIPLQASEVQGPVQAVFRLLEVRLLVAVLYRGYVALVVLSDPVKASYLAMTQRENPSFRDSLALAALMKRAEIQDATPHMMFASWGDLQMELLVSGTCQHQNLGHWL